MNIKDPLLDLYLYHDLDITTRNKLLYKEYSNKKLTNQDKLTRKLLQLIQQSSLSDEIEIKQKASAAITALNYSNFDFSDLQFPNIKIPYADLSASTINANNFQNVNFDSVKLNGSRVSYQINESDPFKGHTLKVQYFSPTAPVSAIHISPDQTFMITVGMEGRVIMWDFNSLKMIKEIAKLSGETVKASSLSKDGIILALAESNLILLINLVSNQTKSFPTLTNQGKALAISPDNQLLASGDEELLFKIWHIGDITKNNMNSNAAVSNNVEIKRSVDEVQFLQFIDEGSKLVSFGSDQSLNIWQTNTWTNLISVTIPIPNCTLNYISKNEQEFVFAQNQLELKILNIQNLKIVAEKQEQEQQFPKEYWEDETKKFLKFYTQNLYKFASFTLSQTYTPSYDNLRVSFLTNKKHLAATICPFQTTVVAGSYNGDIFVWELKTEKLLHFIKSAHFKCVIAIEYANSGQHFVSSGFENCIKIWDSQKYTLINCIQGSFHQITSISLSPDCTNIVGGTTNGDIKVWEANQGNFKYQLGSKGRESIKITQPINKILHYSRNSKQILSCDDDNKIYQWSLSQQIVLNKGVEHNNKIYCMCENPDKSHLYTSDSVINIWDSNFQRIKTLQKHSSVIIALGTSHQGSILISCDMWGSLNFWQKNKNYVCIKSLRLFCYRKQLLQKAEISPDGTKIVAIGLIGFLCLTSLTNRKNVKSKKVNNAVQKQISWHPSSNYFIVTEQRVIKFYSVSCEKLAEYNIDYPIISLQFNPNGDRLYFASYEHNEYISHCKYGFVGYIEIYDYNSFCKANMQSKIQFPDQK